MKRDARKLADARRAAAYWEREAVLRATTVASSLGVRVLAGRRLADTIERLLEDTQLVRGDARGRLRAAVDDFRALDQ